MPKELEPSRSGASPSARQESKELAQFEAMVKGLPPRQKRGRVNLFFGIDLTASRSSTLEEARKATEAMFQAVTKLPKRGGRAPEVAIKLGFYRGMECRVTSEWLVNADVLCRKMRELSCVGGGTQIGRLLKYATKAAESREISAMVFIGDCYEEPEDELLPLAIKLKEASVPLFVFHEYSSDPDAVLPQQFRRLAEAAGGAYCAFNQASADMLFELLLSIVVYSSGGQAAMLQLAGPQTREGKILREAMLRLAAPAE